MIIIHKGSKYLLDYQLFYTLFLQNLIPNWGKKGNIRDHATINELICLSDMENFNAVFIIDGIPQSEHLIKLNQIAIQQMKILEDTSHRKLLK